MRPRYRQVENVSFDRPTADAIVHSEDKDLTKLPARELFEAFEAWARDEGCADVSGASHAFHPRDDSWENHGYKKTETIFSKEL